MNSLSLLEVRELKMHFRVEAGWVQAVDGVSFAISRGKSLGIVGESGCGKSSLARSLIGLLPSNGTIRGGTIWFNGMDLLKQPDEKLRQIRGDRIAIVLQNALSAFDPVLRVGDQLMEVLQVHRGSSREEARARAVDIFEMVGLSRNHIDYYPHQLSGGMRQRALIAMSVICEPDLLISDEPTTALDVIAQDRVLAELEILQSKMNLGLIYISHDISVISETCDHIAMMYAGEIVEYGETGQIMRHPRHPYTMSLLQSRPTITGPKKTLKSISGVPPDLIRLPSGCRFVERCPLAQATCREAAPAMADVAPGHSSRCLFAAEGVLAEYSAQQELEEADNVTA